MTLSIAMDHEGVLSDIDNPFDKFYNAKYGENVTGEDHTDWDFKTSFTKTNVKEFNETVNYFWREQSVTIPPMESNLAQYLAELFKNYTMDIVTSRVGLTEKMAEWNSRHGIFRGEHYRDIVTIPWGTSKITLPYTDYVDDNPFFVKDFSSREGEGKYLYLRDRPYNRSFVNSEKVKRINSLAEVLPLLSRIH